MSVVPDHTAVRTALWRALHVREDRPPHVLDDEIGLALVDPEPGWLDRPDMDPEATRRTRASIVARARYLDDLVAEQVAAGVDQYVILGAGLDTFAQRHSEIAGRITVFEVDQPQTQAWKRRRLLDLGYGVPSWLRLVPVDFEAARSWWDQLVDNGFDLSRPAVVASAGVSMYLTRQAITATLRQIAELAAGSTLAMTFLLPRELLEPEQRPQLDMAVRGARASGTPFRSFFTPEQMLALARESGFTGTRHVSAADLAERYFTGRTDGVLPSRGEEFLVATV
ncbi:class I SAM-dependent methyltransferase [Nocardia pseudobrasiliensis]|uniref:S-adenosyl-L-methionine-dependent methyltransferase n=1 Tax=Nocardia pseudobrasiliensis TaxID=45979 RepID=A0A370IFI8_9NOCA|nr:class I SAM-dependent methyltransferase [Nocardia pseudobrasiliensis]RDI68911.1 methyltransferase (TIGR00027 family) [Nocardia pseudobrasiliensis]